MTLSITVKDEELIALLRLNAREPIASLARKLGLSRTTVQDRLRRLEQSGTIAGYAVKLGAEVRRGGIRAYVEVSTESRRTAEVMRALAQDPPDRDAAHGQRQVRFRGADPGGLGGGTRSPARPGRGDNRGDADRVGGDPVDQARPAIGTCFVLTDCRWRQVAVCSLPPRSAIEPPGVECSGGRNA